MTYAQLLESLMLLAFSTGWLFSIAKALRVRVASGKSIGFVCLIITGYACGVAAKLLLAFETGVLSPVVWVYAFNMLVCFVDLSLTLWLTGRLAGLRLLAPSRNVS